MPRFIFSTLFIVGMLLVVSSCSRPAENTSEKRNAFLEEVRSSVKKERQKSQGFAQVIKDEIILSLQGPKIAATAQAELLKNVGKAMKVGGPVNAVDFCNVHASSIIDSLSDALKATISRVSDKSRNPNNAASEEEKAIMAFFAQHKQVKDTLVGDTYYKPIVLGMPTCLKCHGKAVSEIDKPTFIIINERYPNDLAKDYALGDMRGLWKISLSSD